MMMIMNNFSSTWKMMKKKFQGGLRKIHILTIKSSSKEQKRGNCDSRKSFGTSVLVLKHTCSLSKSDRQGTMYSTRFYKGATPSISKYPFLHFALFLLAPPVCLFIMICRECAFLCVQYDSNSCSSKRSMHLLLFSLLLSCIYRSDSP